MKSSTKALIANVLQTAALGAASCYLYERDCKIAATICGAAAAVSMLSLGQGINVTNGDAMITTIEKSYIDSILNP